jgi:hypothetical protein
MKNSGKVLQKNVTIKVTLSGVEFLGFGIEFAWPNYWVYQRLGVNWVAVWGKGAIVRKGQI